MNVSEFSSALSATKLQSIVQKSLISSIQREKEAEEREQLRLEEAFHAMSKFVFSQPFKEVVHALSVHGAATEGDLKFMKDLSLDQLFTSQHEPLEQGDKATIRELRLRLLQEEEERIRRVDEEQLLLEEEVRVTRERSQLLKVKAEAAAQKKSEGDAARQAAAEERAVREREEEARQKREQEERVRRSID